MTSKHVLMYQCDHCHKSMRSKKKALAHERGCIRNPNRICAMCERDGREQASMAELLAVMEDTGDIDELRIKAGGCPMCMLAAVYQDNAATGNRPGSEEAMWVDYKAELKRHDAEVEAKAIASGDVIF